MCIRDSKKAGRQSAVLCGGLFLVYIIIMAPVENYYRGQYHNLYFWADQQRYNSLAEETYEKYGDDIFGRKIYIIGNSYQMSDFTARTFFKEFDRDRKAEGTEVYFIDSIHDIGLITNNMLVLKEDPAHNAFQDITDFVRNLKCEAVYGYYRDGWMDESAEVRICLLYTSGCPLNFVCASLSGGTVNTSGTSTPKSSAYAFAVSSMFFTTSAT